MAERRIAPASNKRRSKSERQQQEAEERKRRQEPRINPTLARVKFLEEKKDEE